MHSNAWIYALLRRWKKYILEKAKQKPLWSIQDSCSSWEHGSVMDCDIQNEPSVSYVLILSGLLQASFALYPHCVSTHSARDITHTGTSAQARIDTQTKQTWYKLTVWRVPQFFKAKVKRKGLLSGFHSWLQIHKCRYTNSLTHILKVLRDCVGQ